jgi:hypothetical protein
MGMGSVDDQMAIRAQRAMMCRLTLRWECPLQRDQAQPPSSSSGQPASFALCLCLSSCSVLVFKFTHAGTAAAPARSRSRMAMIECSSGTSSSYEEDEDEDEDDMPPPLVREDAIPDCAAAVRSERAESVTRKFVARASDMGEPRFYSYMLCTALPWACFCQAGRMFPGHCCNLCPRAPIPAWCSGVQ